MAYTIVTPAAAEPISLADARVQCRASSADDAFLTLAIAGARAKCEGIIQRPLINRTVRQAYDAFDPAGLRFDLEPVVSISSVVYTPQTGSDVTLAPEAYQIVTSGPHALLLPAFGTEWPTPKENPGSVVVQYVAGFGATAADVPDDIRTWLLMVITFLYNQREAFDMTGRVAEVPGRFVEGLLDPFRRYGF